MIMTVMFMITVLMGVLGHFYFMGVAWIGIYSVRLGMVVCMRVWM